MFCTLLVVLATLSLVTSVPIYILKPESESSSEEIIYVPYDVDYVPVNGPISTAKTSLDKATAKLSKKSEESNTNPTLIKENTFKALQRFKNNDEDKKIEDFNHLPKSTLKLDFKNAPKPINTETESKFAEDGSSSFDLFEDKFNTDPSESSEDFVLVPISVLKKLQNDLKVDSSDKTHEIVKRQAPGNDFRVYRPVVRFRQVFRNRRKIYRPPAFVGYLNDYDNFPTVA